MYAGLSLACMHTLDVTLSVLSQAKGLKLLSKNKEIQDTFFKLGQEWDLSPDLMNKLEAYTMPPKHHPLKSTISDTTCSVLRVISFHHAGTAWKSMP